MSDARSTEAWIPFGVITRPHGVRGELRLVPHNPTDALPDTVDSIRLSRADEGHEQVAVLGVRATKGALLLTVEGVTGRDEAERLRGAAVSIRRADLPPLAPGELYLHELLGAAVEDAGGASLGVIEEVVSIGGRDLLRIDPGARLLPLADGTLIRWDRERRVARVAVPAGLWDE